ncbi:MAG: hypothetical protein HFG19_03545 [Oscillospiraceae bacterium]|nr:hypothetical protein [Oscillospiraceae bacterium]
MIPAGHVVKEGKIGNTTYRICDDAYRNRTSKDIDRTLHNIAVIGRRILINKKTEVKK